MDERSAWGFFEYVARDLWTDLRPNMGLESAGKVLRIRTSLARSKISTSAMRLIGLKMLKSP